LPRRMVKKHCKVGGEKKTKGRWVKITWERLVNVIGVTWKICRSHSKKVMGTEVRSRIRIYIRDPGQIKKSKKID